MTALSDDRILHWLERGLLVILLLYLGAHTLPRAWGKLNTDFPNYYLSAKLAHEGYDTSRMYEWAWLQREKDHRALDVRVIGMLPITPISTLTMWPLTRFSPLTAKRLWVLLNLGLLVPLCWLLRSLTGLSYQRIALVFTLSFPLHRNLLYGQFYLLLLLLIVAACWAYLHKKDTLAGSLIAVAAACKVFPIFFFVFFVQRKAWRALTAGALTGLATLATSVSIFGWNVHRTYLQEILPWTLHGEGLPPYATASGSISSVLHYLLLDEPQWNPHPWHHSPFWYAILQPTLQIALLAPAILLMRGKGRAPHRTQLEWSALLVASLAISTIPASYNFVLLVFPVCVLTAILLERKRYRWLLVLSIVYLGIGLPLPGPGSVIGPAVLLYIPRLPLMLALLLGTYMLLRSERLVPSSSRSSWTQYVWVAAMTAAVMFSVHYTLERERAVRQEYAYRLPLQTQVLLAASPELASKGIRYLAFTSAGYHLEGTADAIGSDPTMSDELSFATSAKGLWAEEALNPESRIIERGDSSHVIVENAREPMLSADQASLAFVRDYHGRGTLFVRRNFQSQTASDVVLTPPSLNLYEASFLSEHEYVFSAVKGHHPPGIYLSDALHSNTPLDLGEARYPALSPDGRWMAYSHFDRGAWNLWIRNQQTGETRRIADVPCNQIEPSWETDSKTLLYSTDCGRSLWFTAVARRRVVP
ncbi:glycosyltransferase 87 family protein [Tunturibacter empetritectus]|uniref:DUF2029 domain-containing protein n=1 Tax=Tunturiibacter empetritectus TaxID=3069691 RepID=A0A7W8IEA1_9BACT|nr:glycosyltransferase 87 family protein [Edaphobacter lichenicola]MBB5315564.1 hypothetical protein [Edaphobacter lichenicola]